YYTSLNDATNSVNPISGAGSFVSSVQTIYVRVYNVSDPSCFSLTNFNLIVNPIPVVDELENVLVCSNYTLQPLTNGNYFTEINGAGTPLFAGDVITETQTIFIYNQSNGPGSCTANSSFTVTIVDTSDLTPEDVNSCGSYTLPSLNYGKYYTGPSASGTEIPAGTVINSSQTIYYYFITEIAPVCIVDSSFTITILPSIEVGDRADVFECTSYTLPALSIGNYYTGTGASGNQLAPGTVITLSQTIYVYATTTGTSPCSDEDSFEVYIGLPQPQNIAQCNGYTLPQLPIGNYYTGPMGTGQQIPAGTVINTSSTVYIYAPTASGGVNCTDNLNFTISISQPQIDTLSDVTVCESYTLPSLTNGEYYTETDGTGMMLYPGDVILATQTIYIFKRLNSSCFNQSSFTVTILPLPAISSRSDIDICDQYVLTNLQVGNYFTGPDGTGTMLAGGTVITSSQRIYIYAVSGTTPPCVVQNSFQINIFSTSADVMADVTTCDSFTLPTLTATNKYYTQSGGPNGSGVEILPGTVITTSQTIYIFKESLIRTSFSCVDETSFTVTINNTPVIPTIVDVYACNSYTLQPLTLGNYYTGSGGTGTLLQAGDTVTHSQTVYVFAHTNTTPDCTSEISFNITIFNVDVLPNVTTCENYTLPNLTVGQYFTGSNGTGLQLNAGATITTSQTVYIYGLSPYLPRCSDESSFTVTIIDTPIANSVPTALRSVCDMDGNNDGITSFNLTTLSAT
ncbi:MAG: adhesin, partial [Bacteroidia bacterium]